MDAVKIGNKIRELRISKNLSQQDLGEKIFVARKAISKWETGRLIPSVDCLKRLAEVFDVTIEDIIEAKPANSTDKDSIQNVKLKTYDYVFEYGNKVNFSNMKINYVFDKIEIKKIEKGKKVTYHKPIIEVQISVDDENLQTYGLEFSVNADLDFINNLKTKPKNITERLIEGETIFYDPYTKKFEILEIESEGKLYSNPAHAWAAKLKNDILFFKLSIPEKNMFLWFKLKI